MLKKLLTLSFLCSPLFAQDGNALYDQVKPLSPEEAIKTIQVPKGYKLQVVASEPMISEPVDCVCVCASECVSVSRGVRDYDRIRRRSNR